MSLEKIIEKIRTDAEERAYLILQQAEDQARQIMAQSENEAREKAGQIIDEATRSARQKDKRMVLAAQLASRKEILSEKQKAIQNCFESALKKLNKMPERDYLQLIKKMLVSSYTTDFKEVIFSPQDSHRIHQQFIQDVNIGLEKAGKKGSLTISREKREISGGFILKGDRVEVDNSFASLLKYLESDLESEVAKTLFRNL
jgi:V/A-type H+-transporting ATPase subunit E